MSAATLLVLLLVSDADVDAAAVELRRVTHATPNAEVLERVRRATVDLQRAQDTEARRVADLERRVRALEEKRGR